MCDDDLIDDLCDDLRDDVYDDVCDVCPGERRMGDAGRRSSLTPSCDRPVNASPGIRMAWRTSGCLSKYFSFMNEDPGPCSRDKR